MAVAVRALAAVVAPQPKKEAPAVAPADVSLEIAYGPPPELAVSLSDPFSQKRMAQIRSEISTADVERRVATAVDTLLSGAELPVNPFPPLARLNGCRMSGVGCRVSDY